MLFNITKQKSLAILQVIAATFILAAPSLIGEIPKGTGIYVLMIVFSALLWARIKSTRKVDLSLSHFAYLLLGTYTVITSFWAGNKEGNLVYFFAIIVLFLFHSLARDYFAENIAENIKRRTLYLLSISGVICAVVNFFYWIGEIIPVAGKTPLYRGLGTNDFLAIFLYFSILASLLLIKGNSKSRRVLLLLATVGMTFIFLLAKSTAGWIFAVIFTLVFFSKYKGEKAFMTASLLGILVFLIFSMIWIFNSHFSAALPETLSFATKNFFGLGGGFWSARETFMTETYTPAAQVGLFAYFFASSGIIGIMTYVFLVIKSVILFIRLKNITAFAALFLCVAVSILPFGENIAVALLLVGLVSYNEQLCGIDIKINLQNEIIGKITYGTIAIIVISTLLFSHSFVRISANNAYHKKDYASAYSLYRIAGYLNLCDSESLRMATTSLRKSGKIVSLHDVAIETIDKAIKRDKNNLQNIHEKALIYDACGEFELSVQQYRNAVQKSFNKDKYNLLLADELFKIVKKSPKGSAETKRAYEEIITIAQMTESLDHKKEINDIADRAFKYTKGEIVSEG